MRVAGASNKGKAASSAPAAARSGGAAAAAASSSGAGGAAGSQPKQQQQQQKPKQQPKDTKASGGSGGGGSSIAAGTVTLDLAALPAVRGDRDPQQACADLCAHLLELRQGNGADYQEVHAMWVYIYSCSMFAGGVHGAAWWGWGWIGLVQGAT